MWQKIKCWLGWHDWERGCTILTINNRYCLQEGHNCKICRYSFLTCKHCGKAKR